MGFKKRRKKPGNTETQQGILRESELPACIRDSFGDREGGVYNEGSLLERREEKGTHARKKIEKEGNGLLPAKTGLEILNLRKRRERRRER